jgi:hypothetical protein
MPADGEGHLFYQREQRKRSAGTGNQRADVEATVTAIRSIHQVTSPRRDAPRGERQSRDAGATAEVVLGGRVWGVENKHSDRTASTRGGGESRAESRTGDATCGRLPDDSPPNRRQTDADASTAALDRRPDAARAGRATPISSAHACDGACASGGACASSSTWRASCRRPGGVAAAGGATLAARGARRGSAPLI